MAHVPPDFLWSLVALANFMRLSLLKAAHAGMEWSRILANMKLCSIIAR